MSNTWNYEIFEITKASEAAMKSWTMFLRQYLTQNNPEKLLLWYLNLYWLVFKDLMHHTVSSDYYNYVMAKMA